MKAKSMVRLVVCVLAGIPRYLKMYRLSRHYVSFQSAAPTERTRARHTETSHQVGFDCCGLTIGRN